MNRSIGRRRPNALADRIAGLDDPSMGDERERDVILRAYTFGSVVSSYLFFTLGVLFAVIGAGFWTLPLVVGAGVMGIAVSGYCKREGVDFALATARASPTRLVVSYLISAGLALIWVVAMVYHQSTGRPLIEAGLGSTFGSSDGGASIIIGAAVGLILATTVMAVSRYRKLKQARLEAAAAADMEDED